MLFVEIRKKHKNILVLFFSPDCESLTLSRWNLVEPRESTADTHWSGSLSDRSVPL